VKLKRHSPSDNQTMPTTATNPKLAMMIEALDQALEFWISSFIAAVLGSVSVSARMADAKTTYAAAQEVANGFRLYHFENRYRI